MGKGKPSRGGWCKGPEVEEYLADLAKWKKADMARLHEM
jgi:hypothetical protein